MAARGTLNAIKKAHAENAWPAVLDLAVVMECDERNIRNHLAEIERAIDAQAATRSVARFTYKERGPGKKLPVRYEIVLNPLWGHSERLLHGFRRFASESPDGAKIDGIDIYRLRRKEEGSAYSTGSVELTDALTALLAEPGWQPRVHGQITDFDEQVWTAIRPVLILCGTDDLQGERMPDFASLASEVVEGAKPHEIPSRRYDYVLLTRFINDAGQPVFIVRSDYRFGHLAFKALLEDNAAAGMIWKDLALHDEVLAPTEYQFRFRMEMHGQKNTPMGHGDPQVIRPMHFDPPARPKPPASEPGALPKLGVVRKKTTGRS